MKKLQHFWQRHYPVIIILACSVLFLLPFWIHRAYINGHDTNYHLANILGLSNVNPLEMFNAKLIDFIGSDMGYPSGIFYPQLSHIIPATLYQLIAGFGLSVFIACRLAHLLILASSGLLMYRLGRLLKLSRNPSLLVAILYMGSTYHLSDILIRDATAEALVFFFISFVAISLYYLHHQQYRRFLPYFIIGTAGLILSHLVMTIYIGIFFTLYLALNFRSFITPPHKLLMLLLGGGLTLLITAFFWLPLLEALQFTSYTAFTDAFMYSGSDYLQPISIYSLFDLNTNFNSIIWAVNLAALALIIYILVANRTARRNHLLVSLAILSVLAIALMTLFSFRHLPAPFQMIQFQWRLNTILSFTLPLATGLAFTYARPNTRPLWTTIILLCTLIGAAAVWQNTYISTNLTSDSIRNFTVYWADYLPTKSRQSLDYLASRNSQSTVILQGDATILYQASGFPNYQVDIHGVDGSIVVELPRYYAPGYTITASAPDGATTTLNYQESPYGLVTVTVTQDCSLTATYTGTSLQTIGIVISAVTTGATAIGLGVAALKTRRVRR